jgi:hypothetical protein
VQSIPHLKYRQFIKRLKIDHTCSRIPAVWEEVVAGPEGLPFRPSISRRLCVGNLPRFQNRYRSRNRYRYRDQIAGMGDSNFLQKKHRKYRFSHFLNPSNIGPDSDSDPDSDSSMDQLDLKQVNKPRYRSDIHLRFSMEYA